MLRKQKKRKASRVNLKKIREYVRLNAPEPEVLRLIGEESKAKRTDGISSREIDRIVHAAEAKKSANARHNSALR